MDHIKNENCVGYCDASLIEHKKATRMDEKYKMNSDKTTAKIIGILYLTAFFSALIGSQGYIEPVIKAPNSLEMISQNQTGLIWGILLQLLCAVAVVGIAVILLPIIKKYNKNIAYGYLSFRVIESAIIFVSAISLLLLVTLNQEYIETDALQSLPLQVAGTMAKAGHYWAFQMVIIVCGVAGTMLCYVLYQSNLIPRSISVIGIVGYPLSLLAPVLDMLDILDTLQGAGVLLYIPGSIFEIFLLPIWLIIKGFNPITNDGETVSV